MVQTVLIRINQKKLSSEKLEQIYNALEGEEVTIRRIFDNRFTVSGDDLIIEGELDEFLKKIDFHDIELVNVKFRLSLGNLNPKLENYAALNLSQENNHFYFGTTLIDYEFIATRLRIPKKEQILSMFFRSLLGAKLLPLMPVKIKGIVNYTESTNTISFVYPAQKISTLKEWLYAISIAEKVDFDAIVDIFKKTDPEMRRNLEDSLNWLSTQLPELVAKSTTIETIDVLKSYKKSFKFIV